MRSNNPSATRFLLKRNLFIGVCVFLVFFFVFPFWGLSHIPLEKEAILQYPDVQTQARRLTDLVSSRVMNALNLEMMVILSGGTGFLCAMMLMRHLFSRRQGLLHAALPDRRETDWLRRCIAYAVLCVVPMVLSFGLYLVIVAGNGLLPYLAWGKLLSKFGVLLLINLYGFAMGMLSSVLTGTYWAALLAGAVLIAGAEGFAIVWHYLADSYLHTLVETGFVRMMRTLSPAVSLYKGFYRPAEFVWLPGVLAIVLALGASFLLGRIRQTETAERTLAFGWLHTLMGFVLPLMGGSLMGVVVLMSFTTELSLLAGFVLGAALTFWVCRIVFNQRFCGFGRQWYLPAAAALLLVLGAAVLHTDAFGYDHYLPQRESLTAISYRATDYDTDEVITLSSDEALDAAYDWCTLMRDEVDGFENGLNASITNPSAVVVTYQLGSRTIHRLYANQSMRNAAQASLQRVIESEDYRQSLIREAHLEDGLMHSLYLSSRTSVLRSDELYQRFGVFPDYTNLEREQDGPTIDQWLSALKKDIQSRTFAEKQQDAILSLQLNIELPDTGEYLYKSLKIYPGDTNFLKAVFGAQADTILAYATGGYAAGEDMVVLQITYDVSRKELDSAYGDERDLVKSVKLAATPEQAEKWVRSAQSPSADRYYYMPDHEDTSFQRLYVYQMSEVEKYQGIYGYTVPEDKTQFYFQPIPTFMTLDVIQKP